MFPGHFSCTADSRFGHNARMESATKQAADPRLQEAASWAGEFLGIDTPQPLPVSGDASFRRYFRFRDGNRSLILMDAPPDLEDSAPFVDIAGRLREAGLNAPEIISFNFETGFGLVEDFGDTLYRELLDEDSVSTVFPALFDVLVGLTRVEVRDLPLYDEALLHAELELFEKWYLQRHRRRPMTLAEKGTWRALSRQIIDSALSQPQVFVHRDFHSCNLLQTPAGPGIIDFQDGVAGPLSYDLASLLWDRYITWPRQQLEQWMIDMYSRFDLTCGHDEWIRQCDWMGLHRNLKVVGIFARLRHRDGKQGYLEMLPGFYRYLLDVLPIYPEFKHFLEFLEDPTCAP